MTVSYPVKGIVSVWVGTFRSENEFDQCVDGPIRTALGLEVPLARICEVSFQMEQMQIRQIIEGFSGWRSFIDEAVRIAEARRLVNANAALICYHVKCEAAAEVWYDMQFLGSFKGG